MRHEVGGVRVIHHGQQGEGVPGKAKELGQVLLARERLAGAELLADPVIGCQDKSVGRLQACGGGAGRPGGQPPHLPVGTGP